MPELPFSLRRVAVFIGAFLLILVMAELNSRLEELNRLNDRLAQVQTLATQSIQTQAVLQTQVAYAGSDEAVEEWARTEGGSTRPGDQPVVPLGEPGSAPALAPTPAPTPTPLQNWQVWWELFFER
ncbi:MAG: hypothetical protein IT310_03175 [Anaerolineales bacterium]|nr:hypothetical protein [Anaerolineales bacterium]